MREKCGMLFKHGILLLFLFLFVLRVSASGQVNITMNMRNATIDEIINNVRSKTEYRFLYRVEEVSKYGKRDISLKDAGMEELLQVLLKDTELSYTIENGVVIITPGRQQEKNPAKPIVVSGKVIDEKGGSLPGVTILLKGSLIGVSTDEQGKFSIGVSAVDSIVLVASFIGMQSEEIRVNKNKAEGLVIKLKEEAQQMNEVVVTGFMNIRKESFTGNSVTIKKDDLLKVSQTNVIKAIQAFDPSFRIQENNLWGSDPNALPEVYIRGKSGIGVKDLDPGRSQMSKSSLKDNPNLPTFIMDGFEISVTKLYDYDPSRIQSITILKDAAATALYGSRAANGVVVITTVAPKPGKVNVSYSMTGGVSMPDLSDYNLLNAEEKLEVERLAGIYENENPFTQQELMKEYYGKLFNVKRGVDTYWLSKPLRTAFNHKHSLFVEGGSEALRYGLELSYKADNGVMKGSFRDTYGVGLILNYRFKSLQINNHITYDVTKSEESPYGTFSDYVSKQPYDEYQDEYGNYLETLKNWHQQSNSSLANPLYEAGLNNFEKATNEALRNNLGIIWRIIPDLQLKGSFSVTRQMDSGTKFLDPLSNKNEKPLSVSNLSSGELRTNGGNALDWDLQASLAYNRYVNKHNINASVGVSAMSNQQDATSAFYRGFPSGVLNSPNYAQEIVNKPTRTESSSRLFGATGVVNYSYANTYLFDASMRLDGSSKFGSDNKFAPFWSLGAGLNIHNYDFMKNVGFISLLKVRGSYGQTGKVNFPAYAAKTTYLILSEEWYKTGYGAALQALGNKKLSWETTNALDVGAEISLLNNLFYLKGSFYDKRTIDLINDVTIPSSTGFSTYIDNIGEIQNRGFELDFRSELIRTDRLFLAVFGNLAHNKNKILKVSESLKAYNDAVDDFFSDPHSKVEGRRDEPHRKYEEGGSVNSVWGVRSLGINPATGDEIFIRKDGTLTKTWKSSDQVVLGTTEPKAQGTFGFNMTYRRFSLYATFMYEFGGQQYNTTLVSKVENADIYNSNVDRRVLTDRWAKPGDIAKYKKLENGKGNIQTTNPTSRFVQDYNWLSLNSLMLGYDFDPEWIKKAKLSMLRLEASTNDLFRCSSVQQERGLSYPFARSISFSLRASF